MAEAQVLRKLVNPWALHLQKLGLELKCPLCLNLLNKPMLLPCNHIFCSFCIPRAPQRAHECAVCKTQYDEEDIRPAPYMDNIVGIYKVLDASFATTVRQPLSFERSPISACSNGSRRSLEDQNELHNEEIANRRKVTTAEANKCTDAWPSADNNLVGLSDKSDKGVISSCNKVVPCVRLETEETDFNQAPVLSPESSPSFGHSRSLAINSSDQGSRNMLMQPVKNTAKRSVDCLSDAGEDGITPIFTKRQQTLDYCPSDSGVHSIGHLQESVSSAEKGFLSRYTAEPAIEDHLRIGHSTRASDSSNLPGRVCSFCHSSKISEGSGKMIYYDDGKEVEGDLSMSPNVIPVHVKCIEWTPQVYFIGDSIRNLESELKRAAKLKCSSCGLKGAALGCFAKSCRKTYHVPCAFDIQECRWDCEDFLVLCPLHNSVKFPREKSRSRKHSNGLEHPIKTGPLSVNSTKSTFWTSSPSGQQEWVLCGSALSSEEKYLLAKFANLCGATVSKFWKPDVTHIIAATDEKGACTRTLKVLMGILNGRWILTVEWIKACMEANHYVNEEPFEIGSDNHGCLDGPKSGRLRLLNNEPKLFDGLKFYFSGDFLHAYKVDLLELVRTAGGVVIESLEPLMQTPDIQATPTGVLVVYNNDSSSFPFGEESSVVLKRLAEAESIAKRIYSPVIRHTWILECISACKLLPYAF